MRIFKDILPLRALTLLSICFIIVFTFSGIATAQDTFDTEAVKAIVIPGHERIVPTRAHLETYKALIEDMQKILVDIAKSKTFQTIAKESVMRYRDGQDHWNYKETAMVAANLCASQFIKNWAGRVRNANLNAVENCQTMFMHQIILDP